MGPDYRVLVDKARKVSHTGYKRIYNEYPPTRILVQDVARVMQEATQSALSAASLPANYQTLVAANPSNFASEDAAAYDIQLKDDILAQTAVSASAFLSADELNRFQEMRANAIKNTQNYILMERKPMAPVSP